jgi:hypothetical protein
MESPLLAFMRINSPLKQMRLYWTAEGFATDKENAMASTIFKSAVIILGLTCLAASGAWLAPARAADTLEAENTNNGAPTHVLDAENAPGDHAFSNRTYGSYFHGEVPPKADAGSYYYAPVVKLHRTYCSHDEGRKGSNHGGDLGSNGQGKGYMMGHFYGCPDYEGEGMLTEGTWDNEPLQAAVWDAPKWKVDSHTNGAFSDGYARGVPSYESHAMGARQSAPPPVGNR